MKVAFSHRAERDLDRILDSLLDHVSARTAHRLLDRIEKRAASLDAFPKRGAPLRIAGLEHLRFVLEAPYLIVYRVVDATRAVEVVAVLHGARDLGPELLAERIS